MRYLGLDYGSKRIGVAISDTEGRIAFPKTTIFNRSQRGTLKQLTALIEQEKISKIVVGLPSSLGGKDTDQTRLVRSFASVLARETLLSVEFENEMLTTRLAAQSGVSKNHMDESSAALILQSYLDKKIFKSCFRA